METSERARLDAYFARVAREFAPPDLPSSLLVTHMLPERPAFVNAVGKVSRLRAVLPKPRSVHMSARREVEQAYAVDELSRGLFADADAAVTYLETRAAGEDVVLLDVGGYFAPSLDALCERFSGKILGVVEDTENGHKRYTERDKLPCPVMSVARSPLKDPEDFLVGQSVVFSTEALLRGRGDILHGRPALVLGFGKLGSSIARLLHAKGVHVTVYDIDPVRRAQALSQGFSVARNRDDALKNAGLVLCATGSLSLRGEDFPELRNGAYVATVTSSEDELELEGLPDGYTRNSAGEHVTRYSTTGHYFYLLNGGEAVNFIHGASVGPFIFLVQAEIIAAVRALVRGGLDAAPHEVPAADRSTIAATWLHYYNNR
ncbi:adenosylhomocysteinase [Streptomyces cyaneogriseus subsp. noncyanogenus]|uniref:Adenosylhomocysteinase n=1 Tax=Streptomyces cyaneogriseus subsp. noncyanogenus TaxID=477245 RepID=A0A0C5GGD3_9ACTN|nr:adenosylhomocysteinase [Streptomyces cyaneogriseus]AJP03446.1 adenosylhomocysteinase [Streptomyces cyaneogriseus subsp. noncyanogenus]